MFWECSYLTFKAQFKDKFQELSKLGIGIVEDLLCYPHQKWCRAFIGTGSKCDVVENNMTETFNGWILEARHKSIYTMLDAIRVKLMERIRVMREWANTWVSDIAPIIQAKLDKNKEKAYECCIIFNGEHGFEVVKREYSILLT